MRVIEKRIIILLSGLVADPSAVKDRVMSYSEYAAGPRDIIEKTDTGFRYKLFSTTLFKYSSLEHTAKIFLSSYSQTTVSRVKALLKLFFGEDVTRKNGEYIVGGMNLKDAISIKFDRVHSITGSNMLGFTGITVC